MWRTLLLSLFLAACIRESAQVPCYADRACHVTMHPTHCLSQPLICHDFEFCMIHILHDGVHFDCKNKEHEWMKCTETPNPDTCTPLLTHMDVKPGCTYCCQDQQCMHDLHKPTTITAATISAASAGITATAAAGITVTAATAGAQSTAPSQTVSGPATAGDSCYTTSCNPGDTMEECRNGAWACKNNEFCEVHTDYPSQNINMTCTDSKWINFEACQMKLVRHYCSIDGGHAEHECHFCCPDTHCVELIANVLKVPAKKGSCDTDITANSNTTRTPVSGAPTLSTILVSSQPGLTSPAMLTSPQMLHTDTTPTGHVCADGVPDCASKYIDQCSNHIVRVRLCPLTCDACNDVTTSTTPPTAETTTSTNTAPGEQNSTRLCTDCYGLTCLITDSKGKLCPANMPYCMTSVTDPDHGRQIKRTCASQEDCAAVNNDPTCGEVESKMLQGSKCEYCCNEDNCNEPPNLVPKRGLITVNN